MKTIKINSTFSFTFYENDTPDIEYEVGGGYYSHSDSASISVDDAKQLIKELTKFVRSQEIESRHDIHPVCKC